MDSAKNLRAQNSRLLNAQSLSRELVASLGRVATRNLFLQTLSRLFRQQFSYDRLCPKSCDSYDFNYINS